MNHQRKRLNKNNLESINDIFLCVWIGSTNCMVHNSFYIRFFYSICKKKLNKQSQYYPEYSYPLMNSLFCGIPQFILTKYNFKITRILLTLSLVISISSLILIPFCVYYIQGTFSFILTSLLIVIQSIACSVLNNGYFDLASFLPVKYVIGMSTGQGISGIFMNLIRYGIIFAMGDKADDTSLLKSAVIFFCFSGFILLLNIWLLQVFYQLI